MGNVSREIETLKISKGNSKIQKLGKRYFKMSLISLSVD